MDLEFALLREIKNTVKLQVLTHDGFFRLLMKGIFGPYVL